MDRPITDYTAARNLMVDGQVRPNKVYDPRIIAAMRRLPRERFVPPALAARAYADEDVNLGNGRALMEPMVIARLVQMAAVRPGERALVVASGTGYGAALLAACGDRATGAGRHFGRDPGVGAAGGRLAGRGAVRRGADRRRG
jgi:protein-L-isoaspartate(D-aspartate) O-methyltransferase